MNFINLMASTITETLLSSLLFGVWFVICMLVYLRLNSSFTLFNFVMMDFELENPLFWSFAAGIIFGVFQRFITAGIINFKGLNSLESSILISCLVSVGIILFALFLLAIFGGNNPLLAVLIVLSEIGWAIKVFVILLATPSVLSAVISANFIGKGI